MHPRPHGIIAPTHQRRHDTPRSQPSRGLAPTTEDSTQNNKSRPESPISKIVRYRHLPLGYRQADCRFRWAGGCSILAARLSEMGGRGMTDSGRYWTGANPPSLLGACRAHRRSPIVRIMLNRTRRPRGVLAAGPSHPRTSRPNRYWLRSQASVRNAGGRHSPPVPGGC